MIRPTFSRLAALALSTLGSLSAQNVPSWLDQAMGYTLHQPSYYNSGDLRAPRYAHPLETESLTFPGHVRNLSEALAQKSRKFGAGIIRMSITLTSAQPTPSDYRTLDFFGEQVERWVRQGIAVVLQLDGPPGFMAPIATESFASRFASQAPTTPLAQTATNTDLALYDEIWARVIAPAAQLGTALKPAGQNRVILSGRNEPQSAYVPLGHPLSIGLNGSTGEWARMVERFKFHDLRDGQRDMILGSIEMLGTSGSDPEDAYTIHDYRRAGFSSSSNKIRITTEAIGFEVYPNAHASIKYWGVQRSFGSTFNQYVAHVVDDLDMGDRPSRGSVRGRPSRGRSGDAGPAPRRCRAA